MMTIEEGFLSTDVNYYIHVLRFWILKYSISVSVILLYEDKLKIYIIKMLISL